MRELPKGIDQVGTKFRARLSHGRKRISKVFDDLAAAERFRAGAVSTIASGEMVLADGMTVAEWGRSWLPLRRARASYANDRQRWEDHVLPAFGRFPLAAVTRRMVKRWVRGLERAYAPSTVRNCKSLLSVAFADAIDDELVSANPCTRVRVEGRSSPISDDWYLQPSEQAAVLAACGDDPERHMVAVALGSGIRRGELFALHLADVHLDTDPHLVIRYGGWKKGGALKPPKNGKIRRVALFGLALASMRAWAAELGTFAATNPHALAFPHATGARRVYSRDLPAAWKTARRAAPRIRPWWHILRHTCASSLITGWWGPAWSLKEVSDYLGHSSLYVTERYTHLCPSVLDERARRMPVVTLVTAPGGKDAKLLREDGSRPGDLNARGPPVLPAFLGVHDHDVTFRIEEVLRAYLAGDALAVPLAMALLAEMLPPARAAALRGAT